MMWRFVRFITIFNILLVAGVIVFLHYGASQIPDPTNASGWLQMARWSLNLVLFIFYLLLIALMVIFINYVRRAKR